MGCYYTLGDIVEWFDVGQQFQLTTPEQRDLAANVTNDDPLMTGKIAWAHLSEFPDYYTRLAQMEAEAKRFWSQAR